MDKVVRAHLARLAPGAAVRIHRDQGGFVRRAHRLHFPLQARKSQHLLPPCALDPEEPRACALPASFCPACIKHADAGQGRVRRSTPGVQ